MSLIVLAVSIFIHPKTRNNLLILSNNKTYLLTCVIAVVYISSILHGGNLKDYIIMSQLKWLYFFIPIAVYNTVFSKKFIINSMYIACICAVVQSLYSLYFYIEHGKAYVEQLYSVGKFLPTYKIHTHQISILFSVVCAYIIYSYSKLQMNRRQTISMTVIFLFLTIMIHLYAVRSALIIYYLFCIAFMFVFFLKKTSALKMGILLVPVFITCIFWVKSPILKNRIDYLRYDKEQFDRQKKDILNNSDGKRRVSYKCGWELFKKNKWFGVGLGNINEKYEQEIKINFPDLIGKMDILPHSQYLFSLSAFGMVLGSTLIFALVTNGIILFFKKEYFICLLYLAMLLWCIWDIVLGTLFGNSLYIFLISAGIKNQKLENSTY